MLIETQLAAVSVRRVEGITEALRGARVSPGMVSNPGRTIRARIDEWRHRQIEGDHPCVFRDGIVTKRSRAGEVRDVSLLGAIGVTTHGSRGIPGVVEGPGEDRSGWSMVLRHLADRGLCGARLIVSDACRGLPERAAEVLADAQRQRRVAHFSPNVFSLVPSGKVRDIAKRPKAIHARETRKAAGGKMAAVLAGPKAPKLTRAAALLEEGGHETPTSEGFPDSPWLKLRTHPSSGSCGRSGAAPASSAQSRTARPA